MADNIVNTYNLFLDTSTGRDANSKGDNYTFHLGNAGITCDAGQYLRLTLTNFTMHKTWTDINSTNSRFRVHTNGNPGESYQDLTHRNNTTLNAIAQDFADKFAKGVMLAQNLNNTTHTIADLTPTSTDSVGGDSDHIISFLVTFNNAHNVTAAQIHIDPDWGEAYEILGANRTSPNSAGNYTTSAVTVTVESNNALRVQCLYPAQRHTNAFVYLRAGGLPNTSLESTSLAHPTENHRTDTVESDILARIPVDVEYCNFDAQVGREYFMNTRQKQINVLNLRLTDSKNRPLGRAFGSSSKTAAGSGTEQSTLGNLSFSAVIRVDVVQQREIKELETKPAQASTNARFENLLIQPKFGKSEY